MMQGTDTLDGVDTDLQFTVIPAKAGIHFLYYVLDSHLHGNDIRHYF